MKGDIMAIDFVYEDELKLSKDNYEQQFIKIVEAALQYLKIEDDVELSCIIVDDERIHQINKEYRNIDRSTDVISFALESVLCGRNATKFRRYFYFLSSCLYSSRRISAYFKA